jgi:ribosomal protein S18 acetylase RimI-like enzyme
MPNMDIDSIRIRAAEDADQSAIVALWEACGLTRPHNHPPSDLAFARQGANSDVLVAKQKGRIVATAMVGHDGHRGVVYYVAADPALRGRGLGKLIMQAAEDWLVARGVWKLNLMVRKGNEAVTGFYASLGYGEDEVIVLSKRLQPMPHVIA